MGTIWYASFYRNFFKLFYDTVFLHSTYWYEFLIFFGWHQSERSKNLLNFTHWSEFLIFQMISKWAQLLCYLEMLPYLIGILETKHCFFRKAQWMLSTCTALKIPTSVLWISGMTQGILGKMEIFKVKIIMGLLFINYVQLFSSL